jgi:adenine-specific DNA-methyltransferase
MTINKLEPRRALNKAFLKVKPNRENIEAFKTNLTKLLDQINEVESEEFHKNLISDFLKHTYYSPHHFINTKGRNDLVIHNGKDAKSTVGVIVEAKKPTNKAEMLKVDNLNTKAFQELVLYFLRERITGKNLEIRYLIATNIYEWFIFDATVFELRFAQDQALVKQFTDFTEGRLSSLKTDFFYKQIAEPAIASIQNQDQIPFTHFDIRDYEQVLRNIDGQGDRQLIALFKLLSPEHLLKLPFANDSNRLDKTFYSELLYIIGLTETKEGSKKLIGRKKEGDRNAGSLIENAINQLDSLDKIAHLQNPAQFGDTDQDRLFNVGLELAIIWINRVLFLKLLEAQLIKYHRHDRSFAFLNLGKVQNYDDLSRLFFSVLARKYSDRHSSVKEIFANVPYLNSSLFEPTEIEHSTIFISNLRDENLPIFGASVLKDSKGKRRSGNLNGLAYLFEFLDAYDFSSEGSEEIQEENKTLINAAVLGLIFEKINGYKDGSFFTPGFITMYMCRETIRRSVLQKFNEVKGWDCKDLDALYEKITDKREANGIINSLKICDPAVGSGHFLVSALNEIIAIKSELRILGDRQGKSLKDYFIEVVNDELIVTDDEGKLFEYNPKGQESQRVQETLFYEKQTIIENCLFGVDINPNSVKICRLRLWIELLKNAYYKAETNYKELETLPNIDINIKCGNSLISRFALDADVSQVLKKNNFTIDSYKNAVQTYRNAENKEQKREMENLITKIKAGFSSTLLAGDPKKTKLRQLQAELYDIENQLLLLEETKTEIKLREKKVNKLNNEIDKLSVEIEDIESGRLYENALEWRFEFPEVLNNDGDFIGFDVVIGNPPYGVNFSIQEKEFLKGYYTKIHVRTLESFNYFSYRSQEIAGKKSLCSLIIPSSFLNQIEFQKSRELILNNYSLILDINLGDGVFEDVTTSTCIVSLSKKVLNNLILYADLSKIEKSNLPIELNEINSLISQSNLISNQVYSFIFKDHQKLIEKCCIGNLTLKDIAEDVATGISPGLADAFVLKSDEAKIKKLEKDIIKKLIIGGEINSYCLQPKSGKVIIYFSSDLEVKDYPNIIDHLSLYKQRLENRVETKSGIIPYYVMLRPRRKKLFIEPKILIRQTANRIIAAYDEDKWYCLKSGIIVQLPNQSEIQYLYLLALLNSKLMNFLYSDLVNEDARIFPEVKPIQLFKLPIVIPKKKQQLSLEKIVDKILTTKKGDRNADTSRLETAIDNLVYKLYQLTYIEVKIIDPEFELTEQEYTEIKIQ